MTINLQLLKKAAEAATQGEWEVQTGCSWRRIGTPGNDGDVLRPTNHRIDGHPDLAVTTETLEFIAAFNPAVALELIARLERAEKDAMQHGLEMYKSGLEHAAVYVETHCEDGEFHADQISKFPLPDLRYDK